MDNIGRALGALKLRLTTGEADVDDIFGHVIGAMEGHRQLNGRTFEWTAEAALGVYYDEEEAACPARFGALTGGEREALLARLGSWIEQHRDRI